MVEGHADDVIKMRDRVEVVWKTSDCKRVRRSQATKDAPGFSLYADNVGMYNWHKTFLYMT